MPVRSYATLRREGMADAVFNIMSSGRYPHMKTNELLRIVGIDRADIVDAAERRQGIRHRPGAPRKTAPTPGLKWCPRCKDYRPRATFRANRARPDGLQSYCSPCMRKYAREQYLRQQGSA